MILLTTYYSLKSLQIMLSAHLATKINKFCYQINQLTPSQFLLKVESNKEILKWFVICLLKVVASAIKHCHIGISSGLHTNRSIPSFWNQV